MNSRFDAAARDWVKDDNEVKHLRQVPGESYFEEFFNESSHTHVLMERAFKAGAEHGYKEGQLAEVRYREELIRMVKAEERERILEKMKERPFVLADFIYWLESELKAGRV